MAHLYDKAEIITLVYITGEYMHTRIYELYLTSGIHTIVSQGGGAGSDLSGVGCQGIKII